uniref:Cyclin N-terminal domain-containing protein n=1 Tax=viral metagenome TaxID=1070528 RepID=A0A6C0CNS3_9ZZZZ
MATNRELYAESCVRIIRLIEFMVENNSKYPVIHNCFSSTPVRGLTISKFIYRFLDYMPTLSIDAFIIAVIHLDNFIVASKQRLTIHNVFRLFGTAFNLSVKFHEEAAGNPYDLFQRTIACSGVTAADMYIQEIEFLECIDYKMHIEPAQFHQYHTDILNIKA